MKHFEGHEEAVRERIHEDKKKDRIEDEIRHEYKAEEDRAYHLMKDEKKPVEERIAVEEKSERRREHEVAADLADEANARLNSGIDQNERREDSAPAIPSSVIAGACHSHVKCASPPPHERRPWQQSRRSRAFRSALVRIEGPGIRERRLWHEILP